MGCPGCPRLGGPLPYFTILHAGRYITLFKKNVAYVLGAGECTRIVTADGKKYIVSGHVGYWKKQINDSLLFIDAHKSWMYNPKWMNHFNYLDGLVMEGEDKKVFDIGEKRLRHILQLSNYIHPPTPKSLKRL